MKYLKVFLFALVVQAAVYAQVDTNSQHFYMYVYFLNVEQDLGPRLAFSSDGINWQKYNNEQPLFKPALGSNEILCRDPNIILDTSGLFHMVWTTGWTEKMIGYSTSRDLKTWSTQVPINFGDKIANCKNLWAPEIIYDDINKKYMFYWSTNFGSAYNTWYSESSDFKEYSTPKQLFDPGYSVIDATILKIGTGSYCLFFKDERLADDAGVQTKNIHFVSGPTMQGPWSAVSPSITKTGCEGPSAIKIGDTYRLYIDPYGIAPVGYSTYRMVQTLNPLDTSKANRPWAQGAVLKTGTSDFLLSHGSVSEIPRAKLMQVLYNVPEPQDSTPVVPVYPLGKRNTGCGTGVGLAFFPPLFFKVMSYRKRKKTKSRSKSGKM